MSFSHFFLLLTPNFIQLWLENIICNISIHVNLLFFFWPSMSCVLENVSHALENNIYSPILGVVFYRSLLGLFVDLVCSYINYWKGSIEVSIIIVDLLFLPVFCFSLMYFSTLLLCEHMLIVVILQIYMHVIIVG